MAFNPNGVAAESNPKKLAAKFNVMYETDSWFFGTEGNILEKKGIFAKSFPIKEINNIFEYSLSDDLVDISNNFNLNNSLNNPFLEAGFMIDGKYFTSKVDENYQGNFVTLGDIIEKDENKIFWKS